MSDSFVLKWEKFSSTITATFQEIRQEESLLDVTLIVGARQLKTHRLLLSACSPVFRDILRNISSNHPYVYLMGVKYDVLTRILDFIYQGEVVVTQEELKPFLDLANELQIRGLTQSDDDKDKSSKESTSGVYKFMKQHLSTRAKQENQSDQGDGSSSNKGNSEDGATSGPDRKKSRRRKDVSGDEIKVSKVVNSKRRRRTLEGEEVYRKSRQTANYEEEVISDDEDDDEGVLIKTKRKSLKEERTREEIYSEDSTGVKTEISITDNLSDTVDMSEFPKLPADCQKDLVNLKDMSDGNDITIDDKEHLVTLSEALDNLTREYIVQVPDKNWKCLNCAKLFYAKFSCQNHVEAEHLDSENHVCSVCRQKFPTIKAIREHVLSGHRKAGEPLEPCDNQAQQNELVQIDLETENERHRNPSDDLVELDGDGDIPVINL